MKTYFKYLFFVSTHFIFLLWSIDIQAQQLENLDIINGFKEFKFGDAKEKFQGKYKSKMIDIEIAPTGAPIGVKCPLTPKQMLSQLSKNVNSKLQILDTLTLRQ